MKTSMTRRGFVSGACVAAAGLGLAGCDSGTTKKEEGEGTKQVGGSMTMYTPNSETLVNTVIPAFEEATGIKVDLIQAGTGELFKKLQSEASLLTSSGAVLTIFTFQMKISLKNILLPRTTT